MRVSAPISFKHTGLPPGCVVPIISHIPDVPDSFGIHGTGFFVRCQRRVFLITARHCLAPPGANFADLATNLLIPRRPTERSSGQTSRATDFVKFTHTYTVKSLINPDDFVGGGDLDILALEVDITSRRNRCCMLSRAIKLPPQGDWFDASLLHPEEYGPMWVRAQAFPRNGTATEVNYEEQRIITQGVRLVGKVGGVGDYPHSRRVIFEDAAPVTDLNGCSGGPVFLRLPVGIRNFDYYLVGMLVNGVFPHAQFVTVQWLTNAINQVVTI